jgi:hypothetical protein
LVPMELHRSSRLRHPSIGPGTFLSYPGMAGALVGSPWLWTTKHRRQKRGWRCTPPLTPAWPLLRWHISHFHWQFSEIPKAYPWLVGLKASRFARFGPKTGEWQKCSDCERLRFRIDLGSPVGIYHHNSRAACSILFNQFLSETFNIKTFDV